MNVLNSKTENVSSGDGNVNGLIVLFFIIGITIAAILGWVIFPNLLYSNKHQPVNFNHVLHVEEVSEGCETCHYFRDDGSFSGIPKIDICIDCHEEVIGESSSEALFVNEYINKGEEVPWLVYSKQPNCVFFSHAAHVKGEANMDCNECHGNISESEVSRLYEYNKLTGYSRDIWGYNIAGIKSKTEDGMKMDDCAKCHNKTSGSGKHESSVQTGQDACFVCHK